MESKEKTKEQLIEEIKVLQKRIRELENSESERKKVKETLRNSKEFIENVFNSVDEGISVIDTTNFRIVRVNRALLNTLKMEEKDVIGKHCYEVTHHRSKPCEAPNHTCPLVETLKTGRHSSAHHIHGREIYVEVSTFPIRNEKGEIHQVVNFARDITERKKAEEVLKMQVSVLKSMLEGVNVSDENGIILFTNPAFDAMFGYEGGELIGKHVSILNAYSPEENNRIVAEVIEQLKTQEIWIGELNNVRKDKTQFVSYIRVSKLEVSGKLYWVSVQEDITERKKAEEALGKSEEKLRTSEERLKILFEYAPDAIYVNDLKGNFIDGNKTAEELIGYKREELIGKNFLKLKLLALNQIPKAAASLAKNVLGMPTGPDEFVLNRKDGSQTTVEIRTFPVKIKGETLVLGIARDITERKKAEEALAKERNLLRTVMDNLPDYIYIKDTDGRYIISNIAHARFLGVKTSAGIVGKMVFELFPRELAERYAADDQKVIRTGQPLIEREERSVDQKGDKVWNLTTKVPLRDSDGKIVGLVGIARDITERKKAEEELWGRTHDLGERVKELNCLYGVSQLVEKKGISLEEIFQGTVGLLSLAWQYPEITCARIILEGQEFKTGNFRETIWKQASDIIVHGSPIGKLEVCYLEEKPESDEGPFLKEERSLLNDISERLGRITERKKAEEALRESEERYRTLVQNVPIAVYRTTPGPKGKFLMGNPTLLKMFGLDSEEELKEIAVADVHINPKNRKAFSDNLLAQGGVSGVELPLRKKDGTVFWGSVTARVVYNESGKNPYFDCTIMDVTELKRAEDELKKRIRELEIFQRVATGREMKMIELKEKIKELEARSG